MTPATQSPESPRRTETSPLIKADTSHAAFEIVGILRASGGQTACQEEDRTRQSQEPEIA